MKYSLLYTQCVENWLYTYYIYAQIHYFFPDIEYIFEVDQVKTNYIIDSFYFFFKYANR